jgi:autotransporter translocation and assembly factor TamB
MLLYATQLALQTPQVRALALRQVNRLIYGKVSVDHWRIGLAQGRLRLHNVVISPSKESADTVLAVSDVEVNIRLISLALKRLEFQLVRIDKPFVSTTVDTNGHSDVLKAFSSTTPPGKKSEKTLRVVLNAFSINQARIGLNRAHPPLSAFIGGVELRLSGATKPRLLRAQLSCDTVGFLSSKAILGLGKCSVSVSLKDTYLDSSRVVLHAATSQLTLRASTKPQTAPPQLEASLSFDMNIEDFLTMDSLSQPLSGRVRGRGSLQGSLSNPNAFFAVDLSSGQLGGVGLDSLSCRVSLQQNMVRLDTLRLTAGGGTIGSSGWANFAAAFPQGLLPFEQSALKRVPYRLGLRLREMSLDSLMDSMRGRVSGHVDLSGLGLDFSQPALRCSLELGGSGVALYPAMLPSALKLVAKATIDTHNVHLESAQLHCRSINALLSGRYGWDSDYGLQGELAIDSLRDLELFGWAAPPQATGRAKVSFTGHGADYTMSAQLGLEALRWNGLAIDRLQTRSSLSSSGMLIIDTLELQSATSVVRASARGRLFDKWKVRSPQKLAGQLRLESDSLALEDFSDIYSGTLRLSAQLDASATNAKGHLRFQGEKLVTPYQNIALFAMAVSARGDTLFIDSAAVGLADTAMVRCSGWVQNLQALNLRLSSDSIPLGLLAPLSDSSGISGKTQIQLAIAGTIANPAVSGTLLLDRLSLNDKHVATLNCSLAYKDSTLDVRTISGNPFLAATYRPFDKVYRLSAQMTKLNLGPWLSIKKIRSIEPIVTASVDIDGTVGKMVSHAKVNLSEAHLLFESDTLLWLKEPANLSLDNNRFSLPHLTLVSNENGLVRFEAAGNVLSDYKSKALVRLPLKVLQPFLPMLPQLGGRLELEGELAGELKKSPRYRLDAQIRGASCILPGLEQRIEKVEAKIEARDQRLQLTKLSGAIEGGTINALAEVALEGFAVKSLSATVSGNAVPLQFPGYLDLQIDGRLALKGTLDTAAIEGNVDIQRGIYYRDYTPISLRPPRVARKQLAASDTDIGLANRLGLNVEVKTRTNFLLQNNLADLKLAPNLSIGGTLASPVLTGQAAVTEGSVKYQNREFTVNRGVIDFINPYRTEPVVDIVATHTVRDWDVVLKIAGAYPDVSLTLESDDALMEQADLVSLLVFGKTNAEIARGELLDTSNPQQLLAQILNLTLGEDIKRVAGLDKLEVETKPSAEQQQEADFRITVGKQINKHLSTTLAVTTFGRTINQRAGVEYRLLENLILSAYQDAQGENGGEIKVKLEFR